MSLFKSLFGGETRLGVDIGTTSIKVAEIRLAQKGRPALQNYGILETYRYLEHFNEALQTSSLKLLETETAGYLQQLLTRAQIKTKKVVASLPAFAAFTTLIELPLMSDAEIAQALRFQARQYIPLPLSAVTVDWLKAGQRTDESGAPKQQIFLIAMLNEQIERYQRIFKLAGLGPVSVEIESLSLARALTLGLNEPALIIDIGARSSSFSIAQNGILKFVGQTDFAGASLTQALSGGFNVSARRAEQLKKSLTPELSTSIKPLLDVIINEAGRVRSNYENVYKERLKRVILTGGGSRLTGIEKYIESRINLPVVKGNPWERLDYPVELRLAAEDLKVSLAIAIGLGMQQQ